MKRIINSILLLFTIGGGNVLLAQEKPKPKLTGKPVLLPESEEVITTIPIIVPEIASERNPNLANERIISPPFKTPEIEKGNTPKWANDVIITSGAYNHVKLERAPGSSSILFAAVDNGVNAYIYKSTDGGENWYSIYVTASHMDLAVTNEYVFVVYAFNENVYLKKLDYNGNLIATYGIATESYMEDWPAIATDAEKYSSSEWLYVVWEQDDAGSGTEIYFRAFDENGNPVTDAVNIFGSLSFYEYTYPDIAYDGSSENRLHVVAWNTSTNKIYYRGATNFGDSWESNFSYEPPSGYIYRCPHIDSNGDRVLITWEQVKSDMSEVYMAFTYSTNGGLYSSNFVTPRTFSTQYWRPMPVLKNTSNRWYMIKWKKVGSSFYVYYNYTDNPDDPWSLAQISDNGYSVLAQNSFAGTTFGDNELAVVWTDFHTHVAFDGEWRTLIPDISVNPTSWDYGEIELGNVSDKSFVVSNTGNADLHVTGTSITGTDADQFVIASGGGSFTVSPGGSHTITVRFAPTSIGDKSASLRIDSDDPDEDPLYVSLSGTAKPWSGIEETAPKEFSLCENSFDPVHGVTYISFGVPKDAHVVIKIYDIRGQVVRTLVNEVVKAGWHKVAWNGTNDRGSRLPAGIYFYEMEAEGFKAVQKLVLIK